MSRGPGKWQRAVLAVLESKRETADYRLVHGIATHLIDRFYPELWAAECHLPLEDHPLAYGWVSTRDLCTECGADGMVAYKALLRAIDSLERAGQIECLEIMSGSYHEPSRRKKLSRISVDTSEPFGTSGQHLLQG